MKRRCKQIGKVGKRTLLCRVLHPFQKGWQRFVDNTKYFEAIAVCLRWLLYYILLPYDPPLKAGSFFY